jgi:hypothetical protein
MTTKRRKLTPAKAKTLKVILDTLNEAYSADPAAIHSLCFNRVPANRKLLNHPTIQCQQLPATNRPVTVGMLGVLNGVIERLTGTRVYLQYQESRKRGEPVTFTGFKAR